MQFTGANISPPEYVNPVSLSRDAPNLRPRYRQPMPSNFLDTVFKVQIESLQLESA